MTKTKVKEITRSTKTWWAEVLTGALVGTEEASEVIRRYEAGEEFHPLAKSLGVCPRRLKKFLISSGVKIRTRSEVQRAVRARNVFRRPRPAFTECRSCGGPRELTRMARCRKCFRKEEYAKETQRRFAKYGIDEARYLEMLAEQDQKCGICRSSEPGSYGVWHIDHDHKTGVVRGLLCHGCNTGIGSLKDSIVILSSAVDYLSRFVSKSDEDKAETESSKIEKSHDR